MAEEIVGEALLPALGRMTREGDEAELDGESGRRIYLRVLEAVRLVVGERALARHGGGLVRPRARGGDVARRKEALGMNEFLFVGIPYAAVTIAVLGSIVRYRTDRFSISTQSSQFLENRSALLGLERLALRDPAHPRRAPRAPWSRPGGGRACSARRRACTCSR